MKCSICNKEGGMLVPHVNAETNKSQNICTDCLAKQSSQQAKSVEEIDNTIIEYEELLSKTEELIKLMPKEMAVPEGLENIAFTPMSMYNSLQKAVAELKTQRLKKLTEAGSEKALEYELKVAIENEEYEKAAEIKKMIKE